MCFLEIWNFLNRKKGVWLGAREPAIIEIPKSFYQFDLPVREVQKQVNLLENRIAQNMIYKFYL